MASRAIIRAGRVAALSNPYARAGYVAGTYGPRAAWAAGKIARFAYNRWRRGRKRSAKRARKASNVGKRARRKFGDPLGSSNAKRSLLDNDTKHYPCATRTLYVEDLLQFQKDSIRLDARNRDIINFRGCKMCFEIFNNLSQPTYVNVALVSRKDNKESDTDLGSDLWRGNGNMRAFDFTNSTSALTYRCANINTDKYLVHKHKRYLIGANNTSAGFSEQQHSYRMIKWYVPFKRQLRFEDPGEAPTNAPVNANLYLIWWCCRYGQGPGAAPEANSLQFNHRIIRYFRETSSCGC